MEPQSSEYDDTWREVERETQVEGSSKGMKEVLQNLTLTLAKRRIWKTADKRSLMCKDYIHIQFGHIETVP